MIVKAANLQHAQDLDSTQSNSNGSITQLKYRPDIDGLRAVAVLAVVGFHAFPNGEFNRSMQHYLCNSSGGVVWQGSLRTNNT
jgi:peptidoglycan/LPS O-acetylase OafA/YrhL